MKKLILLFLACLTIVTCVQSQVTGTLKSDISLSSDTLTDAGTIYMSSKVGGDYNNCSVYAKLTNISGTTAATVTLEHSTNGSDYYSVPVDSVLTFSAAGVKGIIWSGYRDQYIRLKIVGTGTQSTRVQAGFSFR